MKNVFSTIALTICSILTNANADNYLLLPVPRQITYKHTCTKKPLNKLPQVIKTDPNEITQPQGYKLEISPSKISITAHDRAGVFYAKQTLKQIASQCPKKARCLTITDYPDFAVRGVMLDISRDKVPTMETLENLVDMLASWKINHFQLYTEHTFAYKNHYEVWKDASPMTAEQIRHLDKFCKERFIDLVPNQNSFGHMERWLKHEKYRYLAEAPEDVNTKYGTRKQNSLYPAEPNSIKLISELYDELLPNFTSKYFNVGCDETFELGQGRSKELCEKVGMEQVYLDFLLKIYQQVKKHNRIMMFWADMIQQHPNIVKQIPEDAILMIWAYEANTPKEEYCRTVAETGRKFFVCPGTSAWLSIAGRTDNAKANILTAAENGLKYKAEGFLNTDWGDRGDWEPIIAAYPGFAYGAAVSWSLENNKDINLPDVLSKFAFEDDASVAGQIMYDMGNAYKKTGVEIGNSTVIARLLLMPDWNIDKHTKNKLTAENLQQTKNYIDSLAAKLPNIKITKADAEIVKQEFLLMAALYKHGCDLGIARLAAKDKAIANIPKQTREKLAADIEKIMTDYRKVWLMRNRTGGLEDSIGRMQKLLDLYRQP